MATSSTHPPPALTEDRVALMIEEAVAEALSKTEDRMIAHMDVKFGQMHKFIADAFPNGDPHGHRIYHEGQIESSQAWNKMKGEIATKFLASGLWVALAWLVYAVWAQFKNEVHK